MYTHRDTSRYIYIYIYIAPGPGFSCRSANLQFYCFYNTSSVSHLQYIQIYDLSNLADAWKGPPADLGSIVFTMI